MPSPWVSGRSSRWDATRTASRATAAGAGGADACDLTLSVNSRCSDCYKSAYAVGYDWNYETDEWDSERAICPSIAAGSSCTDSFTPSPDGEVKVEWRADFLTGDCDGVFNGTEFVDCPSGSGGSLDFDCQ